ncbi:MAG: PrsW family intramembrane metalloprotease [Methanobacteriota archaeon]|nr:MAG: PrsW family intramembrane metalloprotease [Euryarchaeota archaeon]
MSVAIEVVQIVALSGLFTLLTIVFYYRKDKYEPEPFTRIILAFFLGVLSVIPALIGELLIALIGGALTFGLLASEPILAIFIAPPVEELSKAMMVIYLSRHRDFDGPLDGLIYGAMVGSGFAMAENVVYGLGAFYELNLNAALGLTLLRGITQILGHPLYTGLIGIGIGGYKVGLYRSKYQKLNQGIGLHMLWNFAATISGITPVGYLALIGIMVYGIIILRKELRFVTELDRMAYENGYYRFKKTFPPHATSVPVQISSPQPVISSPMVPPTPPPNSQYITCPNCNNVFQATAKYCPFCGIQNPQWVSPTAAVNIGVCAVCNGPLFPGDTVCRRCGSVTAVSTPSKVPVTPICGNCGSENYPDAKFCRFCGTPLR